MTLHENQQLLDAKINKMALRHFVFLAREFYKLIMMIMMMMMMMI